MFSNFSILGELFKILALTSLHKLFPNISKLLKLALIFVVAKSIIEKVFSTMRIIKIELPYKISNAFLNDKILIYFNCELFQKFSSDDIMSRLKNMKIRCEYLPN